MSDEKSDRPSNAVTLLSHTTRNLMALLVVVLLLAHVLQWDDLRIDAITLVLIGLLLLLPLIEFIRKIKIGEFEAEIQRAVAEQVERQTEQDLGVQIARVKSELHELRSTDVRDIGMAVEADLAKARNAFEAAVEEYRRNSDDNYWRARVEIDKRLASIRLPNNVISERLQSSLLDEAVTMAAAVCLGNPFPGDSEDESARLLASLISSPFERTRYRAAKSVEWRVQSTHMSESPRYILRAALERAIKIEKSESESVRKALDGAKMAVSN